MVRHTKDSGEKPSSGQAGKAAKPGKTERGAKPEKGAKPAKPERGERVAKALARAGVASRREIERLISLGKVAVNGRLIDTPATFIRKDDILTVNGEVVDKAEATRVWRYHKPAGLVTSHRDPEGRPTVFENLPEGLPRVISVGRLDLNSEGLLLLTNDGELSRALELPATGIRRVYRARAHGRTTQAELDKLQDGITVDGVRYGSIEAKLDKAKEKDGGSNLWITVSLNEGKNREVRRVLEAIGLKVNRLIRLAYGPFQLGTLGVGEVEEVGPRVIREQLAEFIEPENMPKGDRVLSPPAKPSRRPAPKSALANPKAKPSRVRAAVAEREAREAERPARAPRVDRGEGGRGDRPQRSRRDEGDRPYRPRREEGDRPRGDRPYRPREDRDGGERPYRPRREEGDRPKGDRPYRPRREEGDRPQGDRPYRPRREEGDRPRGDRPQRPRGDRPERAEGERTFRPWEERGGGGGDRPRSGGPRKRPEGGGEDRPRGGRPGWAKPRPEGERGGDRPGGKRPFKPRGEGGGSDRPRGPGGPRKGPGGSGPRGGPRKPRPE